MNLFWFVLLFYATLLLHLANRGNVIIKMVKCKKKKEKQLCKLSRISN
jgi:hypothetical protein